MIEEGRLFKYSFIAGGLAVWLLAKVTKSSISIGKIGALGALAYYFYPQIQPHLEAFLKSSETAVTVGTGVNLLTNGAAGAADETLSGQGYMRYASRLT